MVENIKKPIEQIEVLRRAKTNRKPAKVQETLAKNLRLNLMRRKEVQREKVTRNKKEH